MPPSLLYFRKYAHKNLFEAAKHVVADYELVPPEEDYHDRFNRIASQPLHETYDIFEALQVLLSDNPTYKKHQFDPKILDLIAKSRSTIPFSDPIHATMDLYQQIKDEMESHV